MNAIKLWVAVLGITVFSGCTKGLLDTVPNDRLSSEIYWKTDEDAILAANAVYTYLESPESYFSWDGMTDIGHTNSVTATEALIERGQYDATFNRILSEWTNAYAGIRAANFYLINVERVNSSNPELMNRLKAEVRVLRAYLYLKLAALYGDVPLFTNVPDLAESRTLTRVPVGQVWDFVSKELDESAAVLPVVQEETGRITKGAAWALNARALLYAGRYQGAADAAQKVIGLNVYDIYPSYEKLFSYAAENNEEVILDKQFVKSTYRNAVFKLIGPWSQKNSSSAYVPTKALTDAYKMADGKDISDGSGGYDENNPYANRDPRLKFTIFTPGDKLPDGTTYSSRPGSGTADAVDFSWFATQTGFNIKKYVNNEDYADPANGGINLILIRYADVLLMYAEAKVELDQLDQSVLDAINKVRQRADVHLPAINSLPARDELREIVRAERKLELAFEGLRYFDIRRWKIAEGVIPGRVFGLTYTDNGTLKTIEVTSFNRSFNTSRDYLWPVPNREIELNPQLTQNPNW